jgi:hypothetical protein
MFDRIRARRLAPLLLALAFVTACDNDPVEPGDPADDIATIRLTAGTATVNITEGGAQGGLTIPLGATSVTATFLDVAGDSVTIGGEFEIRLTSSNSALVTFARTGQFAGTLTGVAAGSAIVAVELFHTGEGHSDFGPHNLTVTVQ